MAGKESDYRVFVGGLSWDVTERQLADAFGRFGKVMDCQIMVDRDTGRPRGFGFLNFSDRRGMENAIRGMDGTELGEHAISVNRAVPKMGGGEPDHGFNESYSVGRRGSSSYGGGGERSLGQDVCFRCNRAGHWARDCPSVAIGGRGGPPTVRESRYGDRYVERERLVDDRYDGGRFGERERYGSRDNKYGSRDRYLDDRYPQSGEGYGEERYGGLERYAQNGNGKERGYGREIGPGRSSDRYGVGGPTPRYEGRSFRNRAAPYDRPKRGGARPSAYEHY